MLIFNNQLILTEINNICFNYYRNTRDKCLILACYQQFEKRMRFLVLITFFTFYNPTISFSQYEDNAKIYKVAVEHSIKNRYKRIKKKKEIMVLDSTNQLSEHEWLTENIESHLFNPPLEQEKITEIKILINQLIEDSICKKNNIEAINTIPKKRVISEKSLREIFTISPENGWNLFYIKFPKSIGFITISKIKKYEDFSVVYVDYHFDSLGASGDLYVLKLVDGNWMIYSELNVYVS